MSESSVASLSVNLVALFQQILLRFVDKSAEFFVAFLLENLIASLSENLDSSLFLIGKSSCISSENLVAPLLENLVAYHVCWIFLLNIVGVVLT